MGKTNIISTQSKSDLSAAHQSKQLNKMIENGHAVITQQSEDLFEPLITDTVKTDNG